MTASRDSGWRSAYEDFSRRQRERADAAATFTEREKILNEPVHDAARDTLVRSFVDAEGRLHAFFVARRELDLNAPFVLYDGAQRVKDDVGVDVHGTCEAVKAHADALAGKLKGDA